MRSNQTEEDVQTEALLQPPAPLNGKIVKVSRPIPPLYKYCHADRVDVLRGQMIRYSSAAALNDPFELRPHIAAGASPEFIQASFDRSLEEQVHLEFEKVPDDLQALLPRDAFLALMKAIAPLTDEMSKMIMPAMMYGLFRLVESIGILCLTESPANLLMWAHYADSHRGFVIEFDPDSPFFDRRVSHEDALRHLKQVHYSIERPSVVLTEMEEGELFLTKGADWKYETEWRMMDATVNSTRTIGSGPETIQLFAFPGTAILSIIFGCRMPETTRAEIREIVAANPEYTHIVCKQATIDEKQYRVLIVSCP